MIFLEDFMQPHPIAGISLPSEVMDLFWLMWQVMLTLEEQELDWHNGREKTNYAFWKCPMGTIVSSKCLVCAVAS